MFVPFPWLQCVIVLSFDLIWKKANVFTMLLTPSLVVILLQFMTSVGLRCYDILAHIESCASWLRQPRLLCSCWVWSLVMNSSRKFNLSWCAYELQRSLAPNFVHTVWWHVVDSLLQRIKFFLHSISCVWAGTAQNPYIWCEGLLFFLVNEGLCRQICKDTSIEKVVVSCMCSMQGPQSVRLSFNDMAGLFYVQPVQMVPIHSWHPKVEKKMGHLFLKYF